ncbi:hypothetical protein COOONC_21051 [Cooperia oncophora]
MPGATEDNTDATYPGRLFQTPYGMGWRAILPMYNTEKVPSKEKWAADEIAIPSSHAQLLGDEYLTRFERSMSEKMKSLKGRYNSQIRDILFGK